MRDKIYIMELILKIMEVKVYIMEQKGNIRAELSKFIQLNMQNRQINIETREAEIKRVRIKSTQIIHFENPTMERILHAINFQ